MVGGTLGIGAFSFAVRYDSSRARDPSFGTGGLFQSPGNQNDQVSGSGRCSAARRVGTSNTLIVACLGDGGDTATSPRVFVITEAGTRLTTFGAAGFIDLSRGTTDVFTAGTEH
jgi:hypothetical protein